MRVAFLTNSILATESIAYLHSTGLLKAIGTLERNKLLRSQLEAFTSQNNITFAFFNKQSLESNLNEFLRKEEIELVIVQTFPYKIPASSLRMPNIGFYNVHPGPLPHYRGPDPVFWVLKNKEKAGAITLHKMEEEYDTGAIVLCESISIHPTDTYGILNSHLAHAAPELISKFLELLASPVHLPLREQSTSEASYQQKPTVESLMIDWTRDTSQDIQALTQASNPNQNGSIAFFRDVITRFLEVDVLTPEFSANLSPGTVLTADDSRGLQIKCIDKQVIRLNIVHVDEGYFTGKRFVEVFNVKIGEKFTPPSFLS